MWMIYIDFRPFSSQFCTVLPLDAQIHHMRSYNDELASRYSLTQILFYVTQPSGLKRHCLNCISVNSFFQKDFYICQIGTECRKLKVLCLIYFVDCVIHLWSSPIVFLCLENLYSGMLFFSNMVEDKTSLGLAYVDFLVHIHGQIKSKMA